MNLVVQCARIYTRTIRTPADGGNWTAQLIHTDGVLWALVPAFPHANGTVVRSGDDELNASASCESSVQGINDSSVRMEFTHTLAGREVRDAQCVVSRNGIEYLRGKRPL